MDSRVGAGGLVVGVLVIAVLFVVAGTTTPNPGLKDALAALAVIGAAAVAIERALEAGWTAVGIFGSSWWPLSALSRGIDQFVGDIDGVAKPFLTEVESAIDQVSKQEQWAADQVQAARGEVQSAQALLAQFKALKPGDARANLMLGSASQAVSSLQAKYASPRVQAAGTAALGAIAEVRALVGGLTDNPGRRIISIFVGAAAGLVIVRYLGLDLFRAATGVAASPPGTFQWGIALTGVVMGLGSSPTHEVIKAIQEFKQNLSAAAPPRPN